MNRLGILRLTRVAVSTLLLAGTAHAGTLKQTVAGGVYQNYLSAPKNIKERGPAILVLPEWWGVTDFERGVADRLAGEGYTVLVVDLYGEGKSTDDPATAAHWMQASEKDDKQLNQRFAQAGDLLLKQPHVDPKRLGVIGFGLGGGLALDQARLGLPMKSVVNYYGGVTNEGRLVDQPIKAEILELVGSRDQFTSAEQLQDLRREMKAAHAKLQVEVFKDVYQSFPNKLADAAGTKHHKPFQYDQAASDRAWKITVEFLKRTLK